MEPGHVLSKIRGELKVRNLCTELELGLLPKHDVSDYVFGRLASLYNDELASAIYSRTEGHPLFMAMLADQLAAGGAGLSPEAMLDGTVPSDLATFIELRLADLGAAERRLLEAASVAGITFSAAEIETAVDGIDGQPAIERLTESLCRRAEFLEEAEPARWPDGTLTGCYHFRHALYAEVIRKTISHVRRMRLHRSIGDSTAPRSGHHLNSICCWRSARSGSCLKAMAPRRSKQRSQGRANFAPSRPWLVIASPSCAVLRPSIISAPTSKRRIAWGRGLSLMARPPIQPMMAIWSKGT